MSKIGWAYWTSNGSGTGSVKTASLGAGQQPTATVSGRDVTLNWNAATNAATYVIGRANYGAQSLTTTPNGTCATPVTGTTCVDTGLPENGSTATNWTYSDTPHLNSWDAATSPPSAEVTIGAPSLSLTTTAFTARGGATAATVSNFFDNESVTYCLDQASAPCITSQLGADTVAASGGTTTTALALPAGIQVGSHTVYPLAVLHPPS
jgi:hypothetical protein